MPLNNSIGGEVKRVSVFGGQAFVKPLVYPILQVKVLSQRSALLTTLTSLFVERGHRRGTWWKIYTLHLSGFMVEKSHTLPSQIRRSWNFASCDDSRNRRQADLSNRPGRSCRACLVN
jgi:hypothetical protein